jgi:hypothetical protein
VAWSVEAHPGRPLGVDGGALDDAASDLPVVRFERGEGALVIPAGGPALRLHALAFVLRVAVLPGADPATAEPPIASEVSVLADRAWQPAAAWSLPGPGTYLGLVALEKWPRTVEAVRLSLRGASEVAIYDLALLTFG